jgi:hypothetical protein
MNDIFSRPTQLTKQAWRDLANHCESSEYPELEIDALVEALHVSLQIRHMHPEPFTWEYDGDRAIICVGPESKIISRSRMGTPRESLEAIVARIEENLTDCSWQVTRMGFAQAHACIFPFGERGPSRASFGVSWNPFLALCAAFFRAMAEKTGE